MATREDDKDKTTTSEPEASDNEVIESQAIERVDGEASAAGMSEGEEEAPAHLGATKYVHAAFFVAGILVAYLSGKILLALWNNLAEWSMATRAVPQLLSYAEQDRATYTMMAGAVIGLLAVVQTYRKESTRRWADEVAGELSRVTWPNKDTVSNGTIVVLVASAVATGYIALLDRFWGFVTNLVYR